VNHNGEAETVKISLRPKKGIKKSQLEYDFSTLAIKGRGSRGNLVTKYPIAKIQLKAKGVTTLGGKDIWYDPDIQRLNEDGRGEHIGQYSGNDRVLAIFSDGSYYTTNYELVNKYQGDVIRIGKLDPNRTFTVLYWDNAAKAYYIKRFSFVESNNTPVSFISDAKGSKLVDLSDDLHPQVKLTFGGRQEGREAEVIDAEEFIAKKGLAAKGKKCSSLDLKSVEFIEPLHKPEDDLAPEDEEPIDIAPEDEDIEVAEPVEVTDTAVVEPEVAEPEVAEPAEAPAPVATEDEPIEIELDIDIPELPAEPKPAKAP
jgi:topoisomerase-4 subunit A